METKQSELDSDYIVCRCGGLAKWRGYDATARKSVYDGEMICAECQEKESREII